MPRNRKSEGSYTIKKIEMTRHPTCLGPRKQLSEGKTIVGQHVDKFCDTPV